MRRQRWIFLLLLTIALLALPSAEAAGSTTMAVMPFSSTGGPSEAWLSKGIGDLAASALSQAPGTVVLERDQLKAFLQEMELGKAPLFDESTALRVGRVARVEQMVFGAYERHGSRVSISAFVLELQSQRVISSDQESGGLDNLPRLVATLALRLLQKRGAALSEAEQNRIRKPVTDSLSAVEHFYRGLDAYDQGLYPDALGEFVSASQRDPSYLDAALWVGRLFEAQGYFEHAVLSYRDLFRRYPRETESLDALLFAGRLLHEELHQEERALVQFRTVAQLDPASPQALEAAFQMGQIDEAQKNWTDAYGHYRFIEKFAVRVTEQPQSLENTARRKSRSFTWARVLSLYPDAMVHAISAYESLLQAGQTPEPPRGVLRVTPERPAFAEEQFRTTPSLFLTPQNSPNWKEEFYAVAAPAGFEMTGIELSITGQLNEIQPNRDYTLRVMPFPMPRQFFNRWLGTIYGQTPQMTTLKKTVSFHGIARRVVMVQLIENGSTIKGWGVRLKLRKITAHPPIIGQPATADRAEPFYEGQRIAHIPLATRGFGGATRPSSQSFYGPERRLALLNLPTGGQMLVMAQGELDGEPTDLYLMQSNSKGTWSELQPLPVNSAAEDYDPRLVAGEDSIPRLTWLSNRRGRGWELWWSQWKDRVWSSPHRIPLEKAVDPGMEPLAATPSALLEYDVIQDRRGWWRLAYYARPTQQLVLMRSRDLETWEVTARIPMPQPYGISLQQDGTEKFYLSHLNEDGLLTLRESTDAIQWTSQIWPRYRSTTPQVGRTQILPRPDGRLSLLVTDKITGLQYAHWSPGSALPSLDLVNRADIQNFAAARLDGEHVMVALENSDGIDIRAYDQFNTSGKNADQDVADWAIYVETEKDSEGNTWRRYTARERFRVPDVTSLAIEPNGRIWWGIETGLMSLYHDEFFATDVSQGFVTNDIRRLFAVPDQPGVIDVEAADGRVWRGSPQQGWVPSPRKPGTDPSYGHRAVDSAKGVWSIPDTDSPSEGLDYFNGHTHKLFNPPHAVFDAPSSIAIDKENNVWVGTWFKGLYKLERKK